MMYTMWDHYNPLLVFFFFIILILFGVFFVLNLFLAVISDSFGKTQDEIEEEERAQAKAKAAARKAHKIKLALLAQDKEAKHELKAHARRGEKRALLKARQGRIAGMGKGRQRIIAKQRAAA